MEKSSSESVSVHIQANTGKLFPISYKVAQFCNRIKTCLEDMEYTGNLVFPTQEKEDVVVGAIECLNIAANKSIRVIEKKDACLKPPLKKLSLPIQNKQFDCYMCQLIKQPVLLNEITNFIHSLDPDDVIMQHFSKNGQKERKSHVQKVCESALVSTTINGYNPFITLNPDIILGDAQTFIAKTGLDKKLLKIYNDENKKKITSPIKKYALLKKCNNEYTYIIHYCSNERVIYTERGSIVSKTKKDDESYTIGSCSPGKMNHLLLNNNDDGSTCVFHCYDESGACDEFLYKNCWYSSRCFGHEKVYFCSGNRKLYCLDNDNILYYYAQTGWRYCVHFPESVVGVSINFAEDILIGFTKNTLYVFYPGESAYQIEVHSLLAVSENSFQIKKASINPQGSLLYLLIEYSSQVTREYLYNFNTQNLQAIGRDRTFLHVCFVRWHPYFIVRAFKDKNQEMSYVVTNLFTYNECVRNLPPLECMYPDGSAYVYSFFDDDAKKRYGVCPFIDDGMEKIVKLLSTISSLKTAMIISDSLTGIKYDGAVLPEMQQLINILYPNNSVTYS